MTKGWKSKPQWEGQAWLSADSSTYRLWPGAKSPAQPKAPWKEGKGGSKSGGIPGYASRRLPDTQAMASVAASAQAGSSGMVTRVQQALNHARKAEARVKKLNADKEKREQQWALWERDMKVAWLREKAQYGRDMEQIDREIVSAMTAQEEARTALRFTFETSAPENTEVPAAMEVEIEDGAAEWFALRHSWEQEAKPDWEGVLERALGHRRAMSQQGNQSSTGGQHARPSDGSLLSPEVAAQLLQSTLGSLPPRHEVAQGHPGHPGAAGSAPVPVDAGTGPPLTSSLGPQVPYPASPSLPNVEVHASTRAGGFPSPSPGSKPRGGERVPVKGAPLQPVHTGTGTGEGLAGKLEQARRSALLPFGNAPLRENCSADSVEPVGETEVQDGTKQGLDEDVRFVEPPQGPREPSGSGLDGLG